MCEEYDLFLTTHREKLLLSLVSEASSQSSQGPTEVLSETQPETLTSERPCSTEALGPQGKSRRKYA